MSLPPDRLPPIVTPYATPTPQKADGMAIASLVLGIVSVVFWLCPLVGIVITLVGLPLGVSSRNRRRTGTATAGIVLCTIGLILSAVNAGVGAYLGATGRNPFANWLRSRMPNPAAAPLSPTSPGSPRRRPAKQVEPADEDENADQPAPENEDKSDAPANPADE